MLFGLPDPYGFVCRLGIGTGLRWGELVRATSTDVRESILTVHSGKLRRVPTPPPLWEEGRSVADSVAG